ncbi:MAG: glycosyltransferase [Opitutales bacterium]|nr:glycosyltransferase [Opitutales bacterium]
MNEKLGIHLKESKIAHLPEMHAYQEALGELLEVEVELVESPVQKNPAHVYWHFMGVHLRRPKYRKVIHDYRSLSTGRFSKLKDRLKGVLNCRPDLRIFLNEEVRQQMNFKDSVPYCLLDMGVPSWIGDLRGDSDEFRYGFCYVGEVTKERGNEVLLEAFVSRNLFDQKLLIVGNVEPEILSRYEGESGIVFTGKVSQREVFEYLSETEYAICHFPRHRPHCYQTPTKLLEYAALGKKIIANKSPSNLRLAKELGIEVYWCSERVFDTYETENTIQDNRKFDASTLTWRKRFEESGLLDHLKAWQADIEREEFISSRFK